MSFILGGAQNRFAHFNAKKKVLNYLSGASPAPSADKMANMGTAIQPVHAGSYRLRLLALTV